MHKQTSPDVNLRIDHLTVVLRIDPRMNLLLPWHFMKLSTGRKDVVKGTYVSLTLTLELYTRIIDLFFFFKIYMQSVLLQLTICANAAAVALLCLPGIYLWFLFTLICLMTMD